MEQHIEIKMNELELHISTCINFKKNKIQLVLKGDYEEGQMAESFHEPLF